MTCNFDASSLSLKSDFPDKKYIETDEQSDEIIKFSAILKNTCQANRGNWSALIANAITAGEMDLHSLAKWKFFAKAGLVGDDVNAALNCLLEALNIGYTDHETFTILQSVVHYHLMETLEVR